MRTQSLESNDAFNTTWIVFSNVYFDNMVSQIYPSELQLNKAVLYLW